MTDELLQKYDMTIGIECHVQLATTTKLFSGADNDARDKTPNSVVSPIDFGLPGMLPVLNREAVNLAIKAGKALGSDIARVSRFDRKHYFYPDLPNGYQITQMYHPIILAGSVTAPLEDGSQVTVRIHHAHMETDAGKLTHFSDHSLVDLNRAGTPLIEVVSEPDMHSALEAKAFATELYRLMTYAGVTHGDLYNGNMRFDVNISIAPKGATELGKRAEVKNLNSFKSVEKAAEYEFRRQAALLDHGDKVVQETRGWDEATQKTNSQRSKEDAQDYRYMPDADIPPIILSDEEITEIQATVPKLPPFYRQSWKQMNLDSTVVNALLISKSLAETVQRILENAGESAARRSALWLLMTVTDEDVLTDKISISDDKLVDLAEMVDKNELSSTAAKDVFFEMQTSNESPREVAERKNLIQVSDEGAIGLIVDEVLADPASAKAIEDIKNGNDKVIGFLVGQIMKKSQGKANPALAQKLIRERL
ncbi:MAG: Asp-tRNA(Asn)/Glu-tRNA(Gln) amidotransferase subunit GatB [Candidatus Saccharimonadales bacterium]